MTTAEILESENNKTQKMRLLFELGLSRKEVSELMNVGYGFVQNVFAKTYPDRINGRQEFRFTFNRKFGIEIEAHGCPKAELARALRQAGIEANCEGYNHRTPAAWKITSDSSLRGDNTFELVSPILQGEDGLEQLKTVCRVLKEKRVKINKSCGLHVHLDARGLDLNTWKNIYKNYIKFEPVIDKFMPASRRANNNRYCHSLIKENYETKINESGSLQEIERAITGRDRYYKLNTQAYWRHNTVEFRQHAGTIEFEKISNWILFCARFVEYSKKKTATEGTIEGMKAFLSEDILNYIENRINHFAA